VSEVVLESAQARPRGPLAAVVAAHHGFRVRHAEPGRHLGLPSPFLTLIFTLDEPLTIARHVDPNVPPGSYRTMAGGLHTSPAVVVHDGAQSGVQVQLDPLGARALFGRPAAEIASLDLPADLLLGPAATDLQERLQAAGDWPARFALLDRHLGRRLLDPARGPAHVPQPEVAHAWRRLRGSLGRVAVSALAREVGWSERHLAARFRAEFGLTPKVAARVIRFDRARRRVRPGNGAEVAAACGFADQSHLVREFHAFTGLSPGAWWAAEVGNVQVTDPEHDADWTA
jgi:AraC-like DNA-binding protein